MHRALDWPRHFGIGTLRNLDGVQNARDHIFGRDFLGFRLIGEQNPVPEHIHADGPNILRRHITTPHEERLGASGLREIDGRPR